MKPVFTKGLHVLQSHEFSLKNQRTTLNRIGPHQPIPGLTPALLKYCYCLFFSFKNILKKIYFFYFKLIFFFYFHIILIDVKNNF
jgi:hypothetical protein